MEIIKRLKQSTKNLSENQRKLLLSIPWIIGCFLFMLIQYKRRQYHYEINDDMFLSFIVNGAYGKYYKYNMFNSFPLSLLFSALYSISNAHNWTFAYYYGYISLSYIVFGVWNIQRNKIIPAYLTSALLVVSSYNALIARMNFTKSASIIIAVGYILLISSVDDDGWKNKQKKLLRILAYVFIIGGFLIRWDICIASLPFLLIMMAYVFFNSKKQIQRLIPFVGVFISLIIIWGSNHIAYSVNPEWRYWATYNVDRASLLDYYTGDYDNYKDQYEELGISKNDFDTLDNWIYADDTVFDLETMKKLVEIRDQSVDKYFAVNRENIETAIINCLDVFKYYSIVYVVIFLFLMTIPLLHIKESIALLGTFAISFGEIFYLVFNQRCPERVLYLPIMLLFVTIIFFMSKNFSQKNWSFNILLLIILVFGFYSSNFYSNYRTPGFQYSGREETLQMLEELSSREDKLYVWDVLEQDILKHVYSPTDVPKYGLMKNHIVLGGWSVPSPIMSERAAKFGEKNNYLKLLSYNKDVFYITKSEELLGIIEQYIREHYNPNVHANLVETINDFKIYSFVSE